MAYLVWTDDLNLGIDVIDQQHRQIAGYINQLYDAKQHKSRGEVAEVLNACVDYTLSHFGFEEALMEDADYAFFKPHQKVHELFIRRIESFKTRFEQGEDITEELHGLLHRWLFNHIRYDDANYVPAVKQKLQMRQAQAQAEQRTKIVAKVDEPHHDSWLQRTVGKFFGLAPKS